MADIKDPILVKVAESVDRITRLTVAAVEQHRAIGVDDDELSHRLWVEFKNAQHRNGSPEAGLLHMAMSCYKLALAEQKISELEESLEFHRTAVDFMVELSEL
jgi:hypothetical protein